jgi:hypothetical protein
MRGMRERADHIRPEVTSESLRHSAVVIPTIGGIHSAPKSCGRTAREQASRPHSHPGRRHPASSPVTVDFSVRVGRWQRPELDPASGPAALAIHLGVDPHRPDPPARL